MDTYPLRFTPILKQTIWGGRRLATQLGKVLGEEDNYAESWEIVDHGEDQSVVENGPLAGKTLEELVADKNIGVLGHSTSSESFPLLLKYLDCNRVLSVQVLSLIHISEPTRRTPISYAVFCLKKKKKK